MIENDLKEIIMNKIFFAKYLPIEGEIKKDDNALNPSNKKVVRVNAACLKNLVTSEWKKVKLFLCSRDIQLEDYKEIEKIYIFHDGSEQPFKVVGEISSDVVWVTEGMEFDEDELGFKMEEFILKPWSELDLEAGFKLLKDGTWKVGIKCPTCKTYH